MGGAREAGGRQERRDEGNWALEFRAPNSQALYRNLDRLHPNRERIEAELAEREKTLFDMDDTLYLYDLTSTYFEGEAADNAQAKRGQARDKRSDCKQVLIGLVPDREGFPKAHEVFEGNPRPPEAQADAGEFGEARWAQTRLHRGGGSGHGRSTTSKGNTVFPRGIYEGA